MSTNDGGPAFPNEYNMDSSDGASKPVPPWGLSIRDYFAAKALQAILSTYVVNNLGTQLKDDFDSSYFNRESALDYDTKLGTNDGAVEIATDSYAFADAMLAAREAKQ